MEYERFMYVRYFKLHLASDEWNHSVKLEVGEFLKFYF